MSDSPPSALGELARMVRPHSRSVITALVCLVGLAPLNLAMPKIVGYVIDNVFRFDGVLPSDVARERLSLLGVVLIVLVLIYLIRNALFYLQKTNIMLVGEHVALELRERLISHLHELSVDFYHQTNPGRISSRVLQDVQAIKQFLQDEMGNVVINALMLVVATVVLVRVDWFLALVTLIVMPAHVVVYYLFRRPILHYSREAKEGIAVVSGNLVSSFSAQGAVTVAAAGAQQMEQERLSNSMRLGMEAQVKQGRYYTLQKVAADLLVGLGVVGLFSVGGYSVLYRNMTGGQFVEFYGYVWLLYPRLLDLVSQAGKFTRTATSVDRVFEIVHMLPDVQENEGAQPYPIEEGSIEYDHVSFSYPYTQVLADVSFSIRAGEHVLITGPSGAGKTTCVNLLPRFRDPDLGAIRIDGRSVRDYTLRSLRRQVGLLFQDCFLFNDTVMANIRYAAPDASDDEVVAASRRAYADEFIEKLPEGYETVVGEGGVQLSQGQKRRLMVARAILKDPRILILDEPLVSLDAEARQRVVEGLSGLISNRTVISITHFPAELPYADKQIHLSDGHATIIDLAGRSATP